MKRLTTISLFIFWMVMTAILSASLFYYQSNRDNQKNNLSTSGVSTNSATSTNEKSNFVIPGSKNNTVNKSALTLDEIAKHNSASDCWLLINNKVYDVTSSITSHPGGAGTIIPNCGKEATQAFNTKEIGRPHSGSANSMLDNLYIGDLNQAVDLVAQSSANKSTASAISSPVQTLATKVAPTSLVNATVAQNSASLSLNMTEIAKHNSRTDCWLLISGKVYNVSSYIVAHPGGAGTIVPTCGTDATQAYATKNGAGPHSGNAHALLAAYYIGTLNQQTSVQQVQQNVQTTNTVTPPATRSDEWEDD